MRTSVLGFANDRAVCKQWRGFTNCDTKIEGENRRRGLQMNLDKIQYMCIGEETTDLIVENNETIGKCEG